MPDGVAHVSLHEAKYSLAMKMQEVIALAASCLRATQLEGPYDFDCVVGLSKSSEWLAQEVSLLFNKPLLSLAEIRMGGRLYVSSALGGMPRHTRKTALLVANTVSTPAPIIRAINVLGRYRTDVRDVLALIDFETHDVVSELSLRYCELRPVFTADDLDDFLQNPTVR